MLNEPYETVEVGIRIEIGPQTLDLENASDRLSKAIGKLLASETMVYPIHAAVLAANGSACLMRYSKDGEVLILTEHEEPQGLLLPIHSLVMDREGYTARILICQKTPTAS